ncbi:MAG: type II 3-dehydroquinate dehydratase [Terrimicrobiaceae bacterium]
MPSTAKFATNSANFCAIPPRAIAPNLDRLGKREPEIYGRATLKDLEKLIRTEARRLGFSTVFFQSAHEGALIDRIHALTDRGVDAFIVNFGTYSHTSIALYDALKASGLPAVEGAHIGYQKTPTIPPEIHDRECLRGNGLGPGFPGLHRGAAAARESIGAPLAWWRLLDRSRATSQARGCHW